jgi:flagellar L-ring protein precursor FlgH
MIEIGLFASASVVVCSLLVACGPRHIAPYTPRSRDWEPPEYAAQDSERAAGSLWSGATPSLFEDSRARRVGDTVVIELDEQTSARGDASTSLTKEGETTMGLSALFGLLGALERAVPSLDTENLLGMESESEFEGDGRTVRSNKLTGRIAVHVRRVLPNGDMYIEGHKVILVNNEELHIYVSGVVRPVDVAGDNTVPSSRIADAQVELTGRGDLTDHQRPGWLRRIINRYGPF